MNKENFLTTAAFMAAGAFVGIIVTADYSYDDTDDIESKTRSGVELIIDYGTRCQYLAYPRGGITPRLNQQGEHVCTKRSH